MTRKKTPSTVSFLKYLGLLSFVIGIVLTYVSVMNYSLTVDYLKYFPSWFSYLIVDIYAILNYKDVLIHHLDTLQL